MIEKALRISKKKKICHWVHNYEMIYLPQQNFPLKGNLVYWNLFLQYTQYTAMIKIYVRFYEKNKCRRFCDQNPIIFRK